MQDEILHTIQQRELDILKEIHRICNEAGIQYFLAYGTLLGTIRHQGFIPWDDDIDIMLTRDNYDKLMRILPEKLNSSYWLQSYKTDNEFWEPYAKVRDRYSIYRENGLDHIDDSKCGIWVDIFPIDSCDISWKTTCRNLIIKTMGMSIRRRMFLQSRKVISRRYKGLTFIWDLFSVKRLRQHRAIAE